MNTSLPPATYLSYSPLLRLLLPLAVGIGAGELCFEQLAPWQTVLLGTAVGVWVICGGWLMRHRGGSGRWPMTLLNVAVALSGCVSAMTARNESVYVWPSEPQTFRAVVTDVPRPTEKSWRARLRLLDEAHRDRVLEVLLVGRERSLQIGDGILLHLRPGELPPPRNPGATDFSAFLRRQGVSGSGVCMRGDWQIMSARVELTFREQALLRRERLMSAYRAHFERHEAAVLGAMTLGHRADLDADTRQLYAHTGTAHILALSGLHLAVLYGLYQTLVLTPLRRRGRRWGMLGVLVGWVGIWSFGFLVGWPVSMVRAGVMFSVAQLLQLFSRSGRAVHGLLLTMLLMLVARPLWLFDIGFQLSCVAVAGILLLRPLIPMPAVLKKPTPQERKSALTKRCAWWQLSVRAAGRWLFELGAVSLVAQLATLPLIAHYFQIISWAGFVASFVAIPAAYLLLSGSVLFALLPIAREWLAVVLSGVLRGMETVLQGVAGVPFSVTAVRWSWWLTAAVYGVLLFAFWHISHRQMFSRRTLMFRSGVVLCGLVAVVGFERLPKTTEAAMLRVYHTPAALALHVVEQSGQTWLLSDDDVRTRRSLSATARNDWNPRGWRVNSLPLHRLFTAEGCEKLEAELHRRKDDSPSVAFAPRVVLMRNLRCAVVCERLSYAFPRRPLEVDLLVLGKGCTRGLKHVLHFYRPQRLVLAASMSAFYREKYVADAAAMGLPVHDVEQKGMFEVRVK